MDRATGVEAATSSLGIFPSNLMFACFVPSTLLDMTSHMEADWPFLEHLPEHAID
jgi:hypothetical protein